jgi:hypothetical protein
LKSIKISSFSVWLAMQTIMKRKKNTLSSRNMSYSGRFSTDEAGYFA